jgi:hypothetical protein
VEGNLPNNECHSTLRSTCMHTMLTSACSSILDWHCCSPSHHLVSASTDRASWSVLSLSTCDLDKYIWCFLFIYTYYIMSPRTYIYCMKFYLLGRCCVLKWNHYVWKYHYNFYDNHTLYFSSSYSSVASSSLMVHGGRFSLSNLRS